MWSTPWPRRRWATCWRQTARGQRVFDVTLSFARGTNVAVIYHNGTWWTAPAPGRGPKGSAPLSCFRGNGIELGGGSGNGWPAFFRTQLACGAYTVVGHQVVDGIDTIKITGASGAFTFWVNPATYLPVQMKLGHERTTFHWLAPTPASLAQLKLTVPAGFKQVPAPAPPGH